MVQLGLQSFELPPDLAQAFICNPLSIVGLALTRLQGVDALVELLASLRVPVLQLLGELAQMHQELGTQNPAVPHLVLDLAHQISSGLCRLEHQLLSLLLEVLVELRLDLLVQQRLCVLGRLLQHGLVVHSLLQASVQVVHAVPALHELLIAVM